MDRGADAGDCRRSEITVERFLALPAAGRALAFEQAGAAQGLSASSIEKDFWVWLMLRELFTLPEVGTSLTFKGGTSLSKAWGLIDRFSEDIDLTIDRKILGFDGERGPEHAASGKEQKRRLEAIKAACQDLVANEVAAALSAQIAAIAGDGGWQLSIDEADPDRQTLLFAYPRSPGPEARYVRPVVKLEFGARGDPWPAEPRYVRPLLVASYPDLFDAPNAEVRALRPERTFWEKALLLHEERGRPGHRPIRHAMSRHYYDVWRLIEGKIAASAVKDKNLFSQVVSHRKIYFRQRWIDYDHITQSSVRMMPAPDHLDEWRRDYAAMQQEMFATPPPPFDQVLAVIEEFQQGLATA